jgi:hypothetical protein
VNDTTNQGPSTWGPATWILMVVVAAVVGVGGAAVLGVGDNALSFSDWFDALTALGVGGMVGKGLSHIGTGK